MHVPPALLNHNKKSHKSALQVTQKHTGDQGYCNDFEVEIQEMFEYR